MTEHEDGPTLSRGRRPRWQIPIQEGRRRPVRWRRPHHGAHAASPALTGSGPVWRRPPARARRSSFTEELRRKDGRRTAREARSLRGPSRARRPHRAPPTSVVSGSNVDGVGVRFFDSGPFSGTREPDHGDRASRGRPAVGLGGIAVTPALPALTFTLSFRYLARAAAPARWTSPGSPPTPSRRPPSNTLYTYTQVFTTSGSTTITIADTGTSNQGVFVERLTSVTRLIARPVGGLSRCTARSDQSVAVGSHWRWLLWQRCRGSLAEPNAPREPYDSGNGWLADSSPWQGTLD